MAFDRQEVHPLITFQCSNNFVRLGFLRLNAKISWNSEIKCSSCRTIYPRMLGFQSLIFHPY